MSDSFIFYGDYEKQIQSETLAQITANKQSILDSIQRAAVEECVSYLKQKYDVSTAFRATVQHKIANTYKAGQTVYLNAPTYVATQTYALGVQVLQAGNVYKCSTAITVAEAFTIGHWTLIGAQYDLYYAVYPQPVFDHTQVYAKGSEVFWKDKVYTCVIPTGILDHAAMLQIGVSGTSQIVNIYPDDAVKGVQYWGLGTAYTIPANTDITNAAWTPGDNRDQKLLMTCIDIALYHVHSRISPRNVPELRVYRYMGEPADRETRGQRILYPTYCALGWLQSAAIGNDITPNLPVIQPEQGRRIRYGGQVKLTNNY
jgi:hypothetical protein